MAVHVLLARIYDILTGAVPPILSPAPETTNQLAPDMTNQLAPDTTSQPAPDTTSQPAPDTMDQTKFSKKQTIGGSDGRAAGWSEVCWESNLFLAHVSVFLSL